MKSMTGYGYSEYSCADFIVTVEIKSYNNRYLEISYAAPSVLSSLENEVSEMVKKVASRGHLDVSVRLKTLRQDCSINVDEATASAYIDALKKLSDICKKQGLDVKPNLEDVASKDGVLTQVRNETADTYKDAVFGCLSEALNGLEATKQADGLATKANLKALIDHIEDCRKQVSSHADELEDLIKTGLKAKMDEMLKDANYDENRILTEVAVLLMRYTINEELVRLGTHITEFNKLLESDEPVGKRMDFLGQEMNREINTIGSKSQIVEINLAVVEMKDSLENIREQIRNVE